MDSKPSSSRDEKVTPPEYALNPEGSRPAESAEYNLADQHDQLARGLKSRHIQFLALGKLFSPPPWCWRICACRFFYLRFANCVFAQQVVPSELVCL